MPDGEHDLVLDYCMRPSHACVREGDRLTHVSGLAVKENTCSTQEVNGGILECLKLFHQGSHNIAVAVVVKILHSRARNKGILSETKYSRNGARSLSYVAYWIQVSTLESTSWV